VYVWGSSKSGGVIVAVNRERKRKIKEKLAIFFIHE